MRSEEICKSSMMAMKAAAESCTSPEVRAVSITTDEPIVKPKKIIDGVTTWLPASSSIQISNALEKGLPATHPMLPPITPDEIGQGLVEIDGKRYIAVAVQNHMAITPNSSRLKAGVPVKTPVTENKTELVDPKLPTDQTVESKRSPTNTDSSSSNDSTTGILIVPCDPSVNNELPADTNCFSSTDSNEEQNEASDHVNDGSILDTRKPTAVEEDKNFSALQYCTVSDYSDIYSALIHTLRYLKVEEILKVARTSRFLYRVATDHNLWQNVKMKNSRIYDWEACANSLLKMQTKKLDLRKMLFPGKPDEIGKMWSKFICAIKRVTCIEQIDLCRCNTSVLDSIAATCPMLVVLNALYIGSGSITFDNIANMNKLKELRLRGLAAINIDGEIKLSNYLQLTVLSLTNVKNLEPEMLIVIGHMESLEVLEIGDCTSLLGDYNVQDMLKNLTKLKKLRFENIRNVSPDYKVLQTISKLENLSSLELINIEIKTGFDSALSLCTNIKELLLIPIYVTQSATTNGLIINGIKDLSSSMKFFAWGLTLELFKMTNMFMEKHSQDPNCATAKKDNSKKSVEESIPVLKYLDKSHEEQANGKNNISTQIDILTSQKLEKIVRTLLPATEVKLLKIPINATWRQNLSDCIRK